MDNREWCRGIGNVYGQGGGKERYEESNGQIEIETEISRRI